MEASALAIEAGIEATHWWFIGRRKLFARILRDLNLPLDSPILDIGTGTGANLRLFQELSYTNLTGLEKSPHAIHFCQEKNLGPVIQGDACSLPFDNQSFSFITATDILEHLEEDGKALLEIHRVLRPGGLVLITVPAFPCLWGLQDQVSHHKRRYKIGQLEKLVTQSGLVKIQSFYFNYLLFFPIWLARQFLRLFSIPLSSENQLNSPWINQCLTRIFSFDVWSTQYWKPPVGVSLLLLAQKPVSRCWHCLEKNKRNQA